MVFANEEGSGLYVGKRVKIRIIHPRVLPGWHAYKGQKAWMMIDEIRAE